MGKKRFSLSNALMITVLAAILVGLASLKESGVPLFYGLDVTFQDRLVRLRNLMSHPPLDDRVVLIGLDDSSARAIGRFGSGTYTVRQPFSEQIPMLRDYYRPSVIAYDIIFKQDKDESFRTEDMLIYDTEKLTRIREHVDALIEEGGTEIESDVLLSLNRLSAEQGNLNFATELSRLAEAEDGRRTHAILAYYFPTDTYQTWKQDDKLGDNPDMLSEDNGLTLPYLRDVSIPMRYVEGLTPEFEFYPHRVDLPSTIFLDVAQLGYINVDRDPDGIPRWYPLLKGLTYDVTDPTTHEERTRRLILPSISLLSVLYYWGIDPAELNATDSWEVDGEPIIQVKLGEYVQIRRPSGTVHRIPIDERGRMFLNYVGRSADFNGVSFYLLTKGAGRMADASAAAGADTADGPAAPDGDSTDSEAAAAAESGYVFYDRIDEMLLDSIAFIGVMETGATDVRPTPVEDHTGLVVVHMTATSNILTDTFLVPVRNGSMVVVLLLYLIIMPASSYMGPVRFSVLQATLFSVYGALLYAGIHFSTFMLPVLAPVIFLLLSYFFVVFYHYVTEQKEKRKIRGMFATMVSSEVLRYLEENPESFSLAGQQAHATIMFSDVAGFTTISEELPPDKLVILLNHYLTPMTEIIRQSQGYVDKYLGDAIMAEWGVPFPNADHARLACLAALDQQIALARLRPELQRDFGVDLHVRMGINSGIVSAGGMGSEKHFSFTVMGDAVNQAARFEPTNKDYGTEIIIGESTYTLARDFIEARLLDRIIVKGKTVPIHIYELVGRKDMIDADLRRLISLYEEALELHWDRRWDEALARLDTALDLFPDDGPCKTLIERIRDYKAKPPADSWQGEYIRRTKD